MYIPNNGVEITSLSKGRGRRLTIIQGGHLGSEAGVDVALGVGRVRVVVGGGERRPPRLDPPPRSELTTPLEHGRVVLVEVVGVVEAALRDLLVVVAMARPQLVHDGGRSDGVPPAWRDASYAYASAAGGRRVLAAAAVVGQIVVVVGGVRVGGVVEGGRVSQLRV